MANANGPRESAIVERILRWLNSLPECYAHKTHGGMFGKAGKPDITGCFRGWRFEIEVKRPGNRPTKLQERELARWAAAGAHVAVVHSLEELQAYFRAWGWMK